MGGTGVVQFVHDSADLLRALNAARKGNFRVRVPAKNGALPPEVAAGLNELFAANHRMAREIFPRGLLQDNLGVPWFAP